MLRVVQANLYIYSCCMAVLVHTQLHATKYNGSLRIKCEDGMGWEEEEEASKDILVLVSDYLVY